MTIAHTSNPASEGGRDPDVSMRARDPAQRIQELLDALRIGLDLELAFVGEFVDGRRVYRFVSGRLERFAATPGDSDPLEATYCHRIADGRMPAAVPDLAAEPSAAGISPMGPARSHVGIPLRLTDGRLFGSLCVAGASARNDLEGMLPMVNNIAAVIARDLEELLADAVARERRFSEVIRLLDADAIDVYLQPVASVETGEVIAVEALSRFKTVPARGPAEWFAEANALGLGIELEIATALAALRWLDFLPCEVRLSINASPELLTRTDLAQQFAGYSAAGKRLIAEVTEHEAVSNYEDLIKAIEPLAAAGISIAVDDVGSGYASLAHMLQLSPDVIKLDIGLVTGVEQDAGRRALIAGMVAFADAVGARVVAEGVETASSLRELRELGVGYAQGYLLARPAPAAETIAACESNGWRLQI